MQVLIGIALILLVGAGATWVPLPRRPRRKRPGRAAPTQRHTGSGVERPSPSPSGGVFVGRLDAAGSPDDAAVGEVVTDAHFCPPEAMQNAPRSGAFWLAEDGDLNPEGFIPTRFPIVRTRPLCESSNGRRYRSAPGQARIGGPAQRVGEAAGVRVRAARTRSTGVRRSAVHVRSSARAASGTTGDGPHPPVVLGFRGRPPQPEWCPAPRVVVLTEPPRAGMQQGQVSFLPGTRGVLVPGGLSAQCACTQHPARWLARRGRRRCRHHRSRRRRTCPRCSRQRPAHRPGPRRRQRRIRTHRRSNLHHIRHPRLGTVPLVIPGVLHGAEERVDALGRRRRRTSGRDERRHRGDADLVGEGEIGCGPRGRSHRSRGPLRTSASLEGRPPGRQAHERLVVADGGSSEYHPVIRRSMNSASHPTERA